MSLRGAEASIAGGVSLLSVSRAGCQGARRRPGNARSSWEPRESFLATCLAGPREGTGPTPPPSAQLPTECADRAGKVPSTLEGWPGPGLAPVHPPHRVLSLVSKACSHPYSQLASYQSTCLHRADLQICSIFRVSIPPCSETRAHAPPETCA